MAFFSCTNRLSCVVALSRCENRASFCERNSLLVRFLAPNSGCKGGGISEFRVRNVLR